MDAGLSIPHQAEVLALRPEVLDELIAGLDPAHVPPEFVIRATYVTKDGVEHTIDGDELAMRLEEGGGVLLGVTDAHVTIDVGAIKRAMIMDVADCYRRVNDIIKTRRRERYKAR